MSKPRIAKTSLCGCFGCHMSLLDIDERILELAEIVEFDRSPIDDIKHISQRCRIGLIEGGCANEENVEVLREFRRNCDVIVSVGDCVRSLSLRDFNKVLRDQRPRKRCPEEILSLINCARLHRRKDKLF